MHNHNHKMTTTTFATSQIETLRAEFSKIERVSIDALPRMHAILAKMSDETLRQTAGAGIKFLSKIAVNACSRRNIRLA